MRARFISFEGGEGAGKTTQVHRLAEWLGAQGIAAIATREPGGSPGAEAIRALLVSGATGRWDGETEALLMTAARRDHVVRTIEPALASGRWVVSDRFTDSTTAYQGYGRGVKLASIEALHRFAVGDTRPDLTLVLDLPVEVGLGRALARSGEETRFERMDRRFHERLRQGFLAIAAAEPQRCRVIDACLDAEGVHRRVIEAVARTFSLALT
ncbi:MAG: dTMP kinase [Proteobacteria bacterium]|nr:dTMP kinase [Pseudomonadota bacterium]MBI3496082.1 dTMP kinase [Pseudomonadota bacterium]